MPQTMTLRQSSARRAWQTCKDGWGGRVLHLLITPTIKTVVSIRWLPRTLQQVEPVFMA